MSVDWNAMVDEYNRGLVRTPVFAPNLSKSVLKNKRGKNRSVAKRPTLAVRGKRARNRPVSFDINKVFNDYSSTVSRAVSNPTFLLCVALVVGYFIAHDFETKRGPLFDAIGDKNDTLSSWFRNNTAKLSGVAVFLPTVVDTQRNFQSLVVVSILFWVILLPSFTVLEYSLQSLSLHTYLRLRTPQSRVLVLILIFLLWLIFYSRSSP